MHSCTQAPSEPVAGRQIRAHGPKPLFVSFHSARELLDDLVALRDPPYVLLVLRERDRQAVTLQGGLGEDDQRKTSRNWTVCPKVRRRGVSGLFSGVRPSEGRWCWPGWRVGHVVSWRCSQEPIVTLASRVLRVSVDG
jgi:hypothetical protein